MQVVTTPLKPFVWNQDNIFTSAPKFLEQKLDKIREIANFAENEIAGCSNTSNFNGSTIKEQAREYRNDIKKCHDIAQEVLCSLDPATSEFDRLSKIPALAQSQMQLADYLERTILQIEDQSHFKNLNTMIGSVAAAGLSLLTIMCATTPIHRETSVLTKAAIGVLGGLTFPGILFTTLGFIGTIEIDNNKIASYKERVKELKTAINNCEQEFRKESSSTSSSKQ